MASDMDIMLAERDAREARAARQESYADEAMLDRSRSILEATGRCVGMLDRDRCAREVTGPPVPLPRAFRRSPPAGIPAEWIPPDPLPNPWTVFVARADIVRCMADGGGEVLAWWASVTADLAAAGWEHSQYLDATRDGFVITMRRPSAPAPMPTGSL